MRDEQLRGTLRLPACVVFTASLGLWIAASGCEHDGVPATGSLPPPVDQGVSLDAAVLPTPCDDGTSDPGCHVARYGPRDQPFTLLGDRSPDPLQQDSQLMRDAAGELRLLGTLEPGAIVWVPTYRKTESGQVSKVDANTIREIARYPAVTCGSLPGGGRADCDGTRGCCSADDWLRYQARKVGLGDTGHQAVQHTEIIAGRTAVDRRGDLYVANNALTGQSSVTRIANDLSRCIDRNGNGRIDTSRDESGDGIITTDCNGDGQPDDLASVQARPCINGMAQEYFGRGDECVLWTTNVFGGPRATSVDLTDGGGPLADVWVGSIDNGAFARLDARSGQIVADTQLSAGCRAWGMAIDGAGIAWVTNLGQSRLRYFDTAQPSRTGEVRDPGWGPMNGDGMAIDRDGNVWVGASVARYSPDRSGGFATLGQGAWTRIAGVDGQGIAADSRSPGAHFVFACTGTSVLEIPASTLPVSKVDQLIMPAPGWPAIRVPCSPVGVDTNQNVWAITGRDITRALVDKTGAVKQPTRGGSPAPGTTCPAGDYCPLDGANSYSNFAGLGADYLRYAPSGTWQVLVRGCHDAQDRPLPTEWWQLSWQADATPGTTIEALVASGNSQDTNDPSWTAPSLPPHSRAPVDLQSALSLNLHPGESAPVADGWLKVHLTLATVRSTVSPVLRSVQVRYRCR